MNKPDDQTDSRRGFLRQVLGTVAATGVTALGASGSGGAANEVGPLRVGANERIAGYTVGPVVMRGENYDFLVFDVERPGGRGRAADPAWAVLRLTQCAGWRTRVEGDQTVRGDAPYAARFERCRAYEVHNSTWVADLVAENPRLASRGRAPLHHLVFTFRESYFECAVSRYDYVIHTGTFDELLDRVADAG